MTQNKSLTTTLATNLQPNRISRLNRAIRYGLLASGLSIAAVITGCGSDDDDIAATIVDEQPDAVSHYTQVTFTPAGSYVHGAFGESAAEITAYHPATQRSFVVNAQNAQVDVVNLADINTPVFVQALETADIGSTVNSVAVHDDLVAVAVQANVKSDNGYVVIYDANTLERLQVIEAGALPDMVTFSPDGQYLLVANEGEPDDTYTVDAEGSITVINIMDIDNPIVQQATFDSYNSQKQQLLDAGVRIFGQKADGSMSTVAEDLEPEYIVVDKDSQTAYVSLQENNAIAIIDIASATVTDIKPLGAKDHSLDNNALDVSDKDDAINITTWPIMGMYMPDSIAYYSVDGNDYIVTANEGDAREWGDFNEEISIADVSVDPAVYNASSCNNMDCADDKALGRIDFSASMGDSNGDGVYEKLYSFGARSFSIWNASNIEEPVYDSGRFMADYTAEHYPDNFNASNDKNKFDNRSDNKGVEPEGLAIGQVGSQTIAFIGLERISSVMAFDVTDPENVAFLGEINTRSFDDDKLDAVKEGTLPANADGDLGPEGLTFISAENSPSGKPLLLVGFEVSGSSRVFELDFSETAAATL